jgi:hypothetical protein
MNWGYKLMIVIFLFLVIMLSMVYYASIQSNEMIDENYYQKEMEYQSVIDAEHNLMNISTNNLVHQDVDEVYITFPKGTYEKMEKGTVELLRIDSKSKDVSMSIQTNGSDRHSIPKSSFSKGMYRVRVKWTSNQVPYYKEETLIVE